MISEFDTVEEMKEDLQKAAEQQVKAEQLADARDKVLEAVIEKTDFELPEGVLAREKEARRAEIQRQLAQGGLTVEAYLEQAEDEEAETPEEFWETIDERSTQALKAQVVLDVYADENKLDVSQQELTELIFRKAQQNRTSPQDEINHMMEHGHMQEWMQEVRRSKALAAIVAAASVTDADGNVVETALAAEEEPEEEAPAVEIIGADDAE